MVEISEKDLKAAVNKMHQKAITNYLETNEKKIVLLL